MADADAPAACPLCAGRTNGVWVETTSDEDRAYGIERWMRILDCAEEEQGGDG